MICCMIDSSHRFLKILIIKKVGPYCRDCRRVKEVSIIPPMASGKHRFLTKVEYVSLFEWRFSSTTL